MNIHFLCFYTSKNCFFHHVSYDQSELVHQDGRFDMHNSICFKLPGALNMTYKVYWYLGFSGLKPNFFSFFFDWAEILAAPPQVYIASVHVKFQPISAIKSGHNSHSKFVNDLIWPFWPLWLMGKFWNFKYGLPICTCGGVAKISEFFGQLFFWP